MRGTAEVSQEAEECVTAAIIARFAARVLQSSRTGLLSLNPFSFRAYMKRTLFSLIADVAMGKAWEAFGGGLSIVQKVEEDIKATAVRFVREIVIGAVLLFAGLGFIVFGLGMALVEMINLGPVAGSLLIGFVFLTLGAGFFVFARRK